MKRVTIIVITVAFGPVRAGVLYHIDQPTPVSLAHGEYYAEARMWGAGGVLARVAVGLFDRLTLGMSYSADHLLGSGDPEMSRSRPELLARVAILREMGYVPDLALGFESQGYDRCAGERFNVKEKGIFLAVGKSLAVSRTYCELGFNWWQGFNGFAVINQLLPGNCELLVEYDPGLNDKADDAWRGGWLNLGFGWTFQERVRVGFALRDIIGNRTDTHFNRIFWVSIQEHF